MSEYQKVLSDLNTTQESWLVTGAAGFIGSNIVETLLRHGQKVRGLDNFSFGHKKNLELVRSNLSDKEWRNFDFIEGDIRKPEVCKNACTGVDNVFHEAALGSVPISINDPVFANQCNIDGFVNVLNAANQSGVRSFVYASSSAVYGDDPTLPKQEGIIGQALSPYALTKHVNELYAGVFAKCYNTRCIGLRYFNIYGQRQDPEGAYAAVIPKWFAEMLRGEKVFINGDGTITRDFCFIADCVQANILAAKAKNDDAWNRVYNVGCSETTNLNDLFNAVRDAVATLRPKASQYKPVYREFRQGDIVHSRADISMAVRMLGFKPVFRLHDGLKKVAPWYARHL